MSSSNLEAAAAAAVAAMDVQQPALPEMATASENNATNGNFVVGSNESGDGTAGGGRIWPMIGDEANYVISGKGEPRRRFIDGKIWPLRTRPRDLRSAKKYQPDEDDVFVATFPKCGTTLTQYICMQLLHDGYRADHGGDELFNTSPMIEVRGSQVVTDHPRPRVIKTHLTFADVPKSPVCKYVFVARNPKDVCVSFFHHHRGLDSNYCFKDGKFDPFFDLFFSGKLEFGDYFDYMLDWMDHLRDANVLLMKYEDVIVDLPGAIKKVAKFLGGDAAKAAADPKRFAQIVHESSFKEMNKEQDRFFPVEISHDSKFRFIRKGTPGDWKNYFSRAQSDLVDRLWKEKMSGTFLEQWWKDVMRF